MGFIGHNEENGMGKYHGSNWDLDFGEQETWSYKNYTRNGIQENLNHINIPRVPIF
jgi:hypothetical protein